MNRGTSTASRREATLDGRGHARAALLLAIVTVAVLTAGAAAEPAPRMQPDPLDMAGARTIVEKAQTLALAGEIEDAIALIEQERERVTAEQTPIRALFSFTQGWLHQRQARSPRGARTGALERSADWYRRALEDAPGDPMASENLALVLRDLGRYEEAVTALSAIVPDIAGPDDYERVVALGDLHARFAVYDQAYETYERAFLARPEAEPAADRLVSLYDRLAGSWTERFFDICERIADAGGAPTAARGYGAIMRRSAAGDDAEHFALRALERWTAIHGEAGTFSRRGLEQLPSPEAWDEPGLAELHLVARDPTDEDASLAFWGDSLRRRHALAGALRSLGRSAARSRDHVKAEAIYRRALAIAPDVEEYREGTDLAGRPMVSLEIASALATLYHTSDLDADGVKFTALMSDLIDRKNMAYLARDLPAIQEFHTVIGLILAERKVWEPDGLWGARYHLERAVEVAQTLADRDPGEYQPQPHLTSVRARGLATRGDTEQAREAYLDAAMGYLDLDALQDAGVMLQSARQASEALPEREPPRLIQLEGILKARRAVPKLQPQDLGRAVDRLDRPKDLGQRADPGAESALDDRFRQRQTIRTLSSAADRAYALGQENEARALARKAIERAVESPGATERDLQKIAQGSGARGAADPGRRTAPPPPRAGPGRLATPGDRARLRRATVDPERVVGGRGGSEFEDPVSAGARITRITIRAGAVIDAIQIHAVEPFRRGNHRMPMVRTRDYPRRGGEGGREVTVDLAQDEHVIGVSGRSARVIESLTIHTNRRRYGPFGGSGGKHAFELLAPRDRRVIGFRGRSGRFLDAIGIILEPRR